jgi:hypothetical protein
MVPRILIVDDEGDFIELVKFSWRPTASTP